MNATATENARILIADDQVDVLEALQILVKNEGFVPQVVTSPRAVVEALQKERFDIVLMDLNYARDTTSGSEGLELLARVRAIDHTLPVVVMTAWGSVDLAVDAMQGGGRDFVQKPWDNDSLISILRRQLDEGRVLRDKERQEQQSRSLMNEVAEAREIQECLLPSGIPQIPGCEVHMTWRPAGSLSGDYFDVLHLRDSIFAFCIADVCGKGVAAALLMAHMRATVRALAPTTERPSELCRQVNRTLADTVPSGKFVTMFYGVVDLATKRLRYTNAGHIPPMLADTTGRCRFLEEGGTVLGAFPDPPFEDREILLQSHDRLVLFTDGIAEATSSTGEEFGTDRIREVVVDHCSSPASELQEHLLNAVSQFASADVHDDATLLIISLP